MNKDSFIDQASPRLREDGYLQTERQEDEELDETMQHLTSPLASPGRFG
jgi:hypothetical protein